MASIQQHQQPDPSPFVPPNNDDTNVGGLGQINFADTNVKVQTSGEIPAHTSLSPARSSDVDNSSGVTEPQSGTSLSSLKDAHVRKNESGRIQWPMRKWALGGIAIGNVGFISHLASRFGAAGHRRLPYVGATIGAVGGYLWGSGANAVSWIAGGVLSGIDRLKSRSKYCQMAEKAVSKFVKDPATIGQDDRGGRTAFLHCRDAIAQATDETVRRYKSQHGSKPTEQQIQNHMNACAKQLAERLDWDKLAQLPSHRYKKFDALAQLPHRSDRIVNKLKGLAADSPLVHTLKMHIDAFQREINNNPDDPEIKKVFEPLTKGAGQGPGSGQPSEEAPPLASSAARDHRATNSNNS